MVLRTENLRKLYGRRPVVDGVSVEVGAGQIVGLLGPNGAGKTTTFYSIVGFVRPDAGHIFLDDHEMTLETARTIMDGGPWGQGFAEPLFDGRFEVISSRVVGDRHWKLVLCPAGSDPAVDAIAFNACETLPVMPRRVHAAYRLDENEWQGRVSLQLRIEYMQEAS